MKNNIYIFGAHSRAQTLAEYLLCLYPETVIAAFLYDNKEENPPQIGEIQVISIEEGTNLHTDYPVYIATRGIYHQQISNHLKRIGFSRIYPVTVELDQQLRNEYMVKHFVSMGRQFVKIDMLKGAEKNRWKDEPTGTDGLTEHDAAAAIYVAVSELDKPLQQQYTMASYEKEILAGAALSEKPVPENIISDNIGDNISHRNRQFSELTALYWLWKHAEEEIIGLAHYRRHFILPEDWNRRMRENHVDVILPVPLYVAPNLAENYKSRHTPLDWDYMMECLKGRSVQEYEEAEAFFRYGLYSPCNMFIMRKGVLNELCEWLFPILFKVAEQGGEKEDGYLNRYPGFLSERLMSFFFDKNRDRYKVVYADKNFLE